jgi:formamidopyrimidine-DNA glycosylase
MPELPEVETVVRQLADHLPGRRVVDVTVHFPDLLREPAAAFIDGLLNREILRVSRRGKNSVLELSDSRILLVNLGMTGQLLYRDGAPAPEEAPYRGVELSLDPRGHLVYADARRFGTLIRYSRREWREVSGRLGPEPLAPALTAAKLHTALRASRSPIRSWLLDQRRLAGIGNIYAAESLFRARLHPLRPARTLTREESSALLRGIRGVLRDAIQARGTTLRDYRTASGGRGDFGSALQVYGREGKACPRCKASVQRIVFGNRSAFFCPRCQPESP